MARAPDMSTQAVKRLLFSIIAAVKKGEIDAKTGNCMIGGCRAVLYANQIENSERRVEADEQLIQRIDEMLEAQRTGGKLPDNFIEGVEVYEEC